MIRLRSGTSSQFKLTVSFLFWKAYDGLGTFHALKGRRVSELYRHFRVSQEATGSLQALTGYPSWSQELLRATQHQLLRTSGTQWDLVASRCG